MTQLQVIGREMRSLRVVANRVLWQVPGRPHFPGAPGREEVADYALRETHAAQAAIDQAMWCAAQSDRYVQLNDRATRSVARRQLCQQ
jgi:hypothetical protein